ncbi:HD domain-containing protein [Halomonas aquatica]|uniref:HD domain-containing protein n=1 Tax=Halomonas aquatica TaxID=3151123 RepID=A0ABV1NJN3_9GAMM
MRRRSKKANSSPVTAIPHERCPAKTFVTDAGDVTFGRNVFNHCQIVGEVARVLTSRYTTPLKAHLFPDGAELVAACHDIGKASPTFVEKLYRAAGRGTHSHPSLANVDPGIERQWGGHAGVSQVAAKRAHDDGFGGPPWQQEYFGNGRSEYVNRWRV